MKLQPAESLQEDYPHISLYLRSLTGEPTPAYTPSLSYSMPEEGEEEEEDNPSPNLPSSTTAHLEESTDTLLDRVKIIMEAAERGELTSEETDEKLREVVEEVVRGQVEVGKRIGEEMDVVQDGEGVQVGREREGNQEGSESGSGKRRKEEPAR